MNNFKKITNSRANAFLGFLFFVILLGVCAYIVLSNPDFQRMHRQDIIKFHFYTRVYTRDAKDLLGKAKTRITGWTKDHGIKIPGLPSAATGGPSQPASFNDLIFNPKILTQEMPTDMIRHQPDEITLCSFDADFLLNSPLNDQEALHLANIFRFCDLSSIAGLRDEHVLTRIANLLKLLHYNAVCEVSPAVGQKNKTLTAYLFHNDRINPLKPAKLFQGATEFHVPPYYGLFKAGSFDFTIVTFQTPASGFPLPSTTPLETVYETLKNENPAVQDVMIFGDFSFQSTEMTWSNNALLPTVARLKKGPIETDKTQPDLLGNFWFRKKDLVEFNGNSGVINIKEELFPSAKKSSASANKPIWAQFKLMPDDD